MAFHAIQMNDDSVAIMQTVDDATPEQCLAKWPVGERARVVSHQPIAPSAIPSDRTFRNAWALTGDRITHDMPKARDILRDRLRAERAPQFAVLDVEYQRADEIKDDAGKLDVAARKLALRDITDHPAIESAETVEALKALTLDVLTKEKT